MKGKVVGLRIWPQRELTLQDTSGSECYFIARLLGAQSKSADRQYMERLLKDLSTHPQAWPFVSPVNGKDVPDYYEIIKNPMGQMQIPCVLCTSTYSTLTRFPNHERETRNKSVSVCR